MSCRLIPLSPRAIPPFRQRWPRARNGPSDGVQGHSNEQRDGRTVRCSRFIICTVHRIRVPHLINQCATVCYFTWRPCSHLSNSPASNARYIRFITLNLDCMVHEVHSCFIAVIESTTRSLHLPRECRVLELRLTLPQGPETCMVV